MARQPAADIGVAFAVAFQAEPHFKMLAFDPVHGLHPAVTGLALNLFSDVALVVKKHVLGHVIDFPPGGRRIGVKIFMLLLNPGMVGNDVVMAEQAFFNRRDPGIFGAFDIGVAEPAADIFMARMQPVGKRNGLLNPGRGLRINKNQVYKGHTHHGCQDDKKNRRLVLCQGGQGLAKSGKEFHRPAAGTDKNADYQNA